MISVTNEKDLELDRNFDLVADEPLERAEVSDDDISDSRVHREAVRLSEELENRASESDFVSRASIGNRKITEGTQSDRVLGVDGKGIYEDMKPGHSEFRNEDLGQVVNVCKRGDKNRGSSLRRRVENGEFDSDDFMTNGRQKVKRTGFGGSSSVGYGYEIGDMIWGKVKSHPWWPGVIYNDSFASPSVRRTKREGHVFVAFFGDSSYGWFEPAELIPFDTNFAEKSRQTNSRTFVLAVEDSVDEVSRRSGLGLACRCRNSNNFRPTNTQGYFAVDLANYEVGGVYSIGQIRRARASFQPRDTVAFMKQLALMARDEVYTSIYFFKNKATVLAYRKAVFEEFDETYAQAFGQQPVRPSCKSSEAVAHPVRVPLSGPMVVAEALGNRGRKSTKSHKSKEQENKEKYIFKRRDESSELKILPTSSTQQPGCVEGSAALSVDDYALEKRTDGNIAESPFAFAESSQCKAQNSSVDPMVGHDPRVHVDTGKKTDEPLKHPDVELGVDKSAPEENKTKKRKIESGVEMPSDCSEKQAAPGGPDSLPKCPLIPQLLNDLQALALNPFHGLDSNIPSIVQNAFTKFRSVVFEKSFSSPETEPNEAIGSVGSELPPHESTKDVSSPKQPKRLIRPEDPAKGGRKRDPSDRQEEMASKRLKKVEDLKAEKRTPKKAPERETRGDGKEANDIKKSTNSSTKAGVRTMRTMLILKFPPNTNLPSGFELKARLARFGPLDHSATRVFWKTFSCRVVFLRKSDAEAAHRHLTGSNSLFGNVSVRSIVRALEAAEHEVQKEDAVEQKPLKSCLKKAEGEEAVTGEATTGGNGGGVSTPHVKFVEEGESSSGGRGGEQLNSGGKSSSSAHGMEFKGISLLPSATAKLGNSYTGYGEAAPRNILNFNGNAGRVGPSPTNIDIGQQMIVLLMKCNELVANVCSFLGYVPYHPL